MDVRSYWISKLPTVRRQSPATGRLVESLLIDDSNIAKSALVEMARMKSSVRLREEENKFRLSKAEAETIIRDASDGVEKLQNYDYKTPELKGKQEYLEHLVVSLERRLSKNSKNEATKAKLDDKEVGFFKKIEIRFKSLFESIGQSKLWNSIKGVLKYTSQTLAMAGIIVVSLFFGIYIKNKYKSVGAGVVTFIISVLVVSIAANQVFSIRKFFKDVWDMIVHLYNTVKSWITGSKDVKSDTIQIAH